MRLPCSRVLSAAVLCFAALAAYAATAPGATLEAKLSARNWKQVNLPATPLGIGEQNGVLWVCGADEMLARSKDQGRTWKLVKYSKGGPPLAAVAFAGNNGWAFGPPSTAYRTTDAGAHWQRVPAPPGDVTVAVAADASHLALRTPTALLISTDGGLHWRSQSVEDAAAGKGLDRVVAIAMPGARRAGALLEVPPPEPTRGAKTATPARQVFLSTRDGGATWKALALPPTMHFVTLRGDHSGYEAFGTAAAGNSLYGAIYRSPDGVEWSLAPLGGVVGWRCQPEGCLNAASAGWVDLSQAQPVYWQVPRWPQRQGEWAAAGNVLCMAGTNLECIEAGPAAAPTLVHIPATLLSRRCLRCTAPEYPQVDREQRVQGVVKMKVVVGPDGVPLSLTVVVSRSGSLERAAAKAVSGWRFKPLMLHGIPVPFTSTVTINFTLAG